ncbi:MAG: hypothetical protein ABIH34_02455 [Nanoarchaeota archaeon]
MKKIIWIPMLIILVVLFLIFFGYPRMAADKYFTPEMNEMRRQVKATNDSSVCEDQKKALARQKCFEILSEMDPDNKELCFEIEGLHSKESCLSRFAVRMQNIHLCEELTDRYDIKGNCYKAIALNTKNSSLCYFAQGDPRWLCFRHFAVRNQDITLCDEGDTEDRVMFCRINVNEKVKDISICEDMESPKYQDYCLKSYSRVTDDVSICSRINDQQIKAECEEV